MRLRELATVPKRAGSVTLEFDSSPHIEPHRQGSTVILPYHPDATFEPLLGGRQFLFTPPRRWWSEPLVWFGGQDERPFLVQLTERPLRALELGGEQGFLDALKPPVIFELEQRSGRPTRRQGDIFAFFVRRGELPRSHLSNNQHVRNWSVFGTRHLLTGAIGQLTIPGLGRQFVGEGRLSAPDHDDLNLPGLHIMSQARGLLNPQLVD